MQFLFVLLLLLGVLGMTSAYQFNPPAPCNGDRELCNTRYSHITQIGAHNSPFHGNSISENQHIGVTEQLDSGIRLLTGQAHLSMFGHIHFCHPRCFVNDKGRINIYLNHVKEWLDKNPGQVVTLLLTNFERIIPIEKFGGAIIDSGLAGYAFTPSKTLALDEWPTLQQMIDDNKRLVVFLDSGADTAKVPFILEEWAYFFETPYSQTDEGSLHLCRFDRPENRDPASRMYILNHVLDKNLFLGWMYPDMSALEVTNSPQSIMDQVTVCNATWGRMPHSILLDHVEVGDVTRSLNRLSAFKEG